MKTEEIQSILAEHKLWLADSERGKRANLVNATLIGANLIYAELRVASLIGANLINANLTGANLTDATLVGASLIGANLTGANLTGANLIGANLTGANLTGAKLTYTNLADDRKWSLAYRWTGETLLFSAGCHTFTLEEAILHWGNADYPDPKCGQRYIRTCQFLHEMNEAGLLIGGK